MFYIIYGTTLSVYNAVVSLAHVRSLHCTARIPWVVRYWMVQKHHVRGYSDRGYFHFGVYGSYSDRPAARTVTPHVIIPDVGSLPTSLPSPFLHLCLCMQSAVLCHNTVWFEMKDLVTTEFSILNEMLVLSTIIMVLVYILCQWFLLCLHK